jgi:cytochrome P450
LSPSVLLDPYENYAALRRAGSVHFLTEHGFWIVLGYDDVVHALKRPEIFSSARPTVRFDPILNEADPPAHTRVRRVLAPHFSSRSAQALEDYAETCASRLLERGDGAAEFDLVENFADPVTELAMGRLLGFSRDETENLMRLLAPHKRSLDGEMYRLLEEWLRAYVERARDLPGESLGGRLARGEGEAALAHEEIVGVLKLLWVAGITTTSRLISASALLLLRHPHARAELMEEPELLPAFVEEAVRLEPSEQMVWRVTREGVELSGAQIPAGEEVRLCLAAANRDPAHFPEPDGLSLRRDPNHHLSFAAGPHYCLGAAAGRAVTRAALAALLTRWPDFDAARPLSALSYEESFSSRALEHLFVRPARRSH